MFVASGYEGLVEGGSITLTAGADIGAGSAPILLDSGVLLTDKVTLSAGADVFIKEMSGNLAVESLVTPGRRGDHGGGRRNRGCQRGGDA